MPNANPLLINELRYDSVGVKAIDFDFGAGYSETWEDVYLTYLACPCCDLTAEYGECYVEGDDCPHCESGDATLVRPTCAPMMNFIWPLPDYRGDPEADQMLLWLSPVNLVLVKIMGGENDEDAYALAMTGGGMNLAWDIAQAYILLGYVPPVVLYDSLPLFAGQNNQQEPFASVLKACFQGLESTRNRLVWAEKKLLDAQRWTGQ